VYALEAELWDRGPNRPKERQQPPDTPNPLTEVHSMDIRVTEATYSKDNYEGSLCAVSDGAACWIAWAAHAQKGSRTFIRRVDGQTPGPIQPLSPNDTMQTRPLCIPSGGDGVRFVWLEKVGRQYAFWSRTHDGSGLSDPEVIYPVATSAKVWESQALLDDSGTLWICWAHSVKGDSRIEILRVLPDGKVAKCALGESIRYNYRPRMVPCGEEGIYVVWDSYTGGTYDVYGASADPSGAGDAVKISGDSEWENKATICRDGDGNLWAAWVRWKDVMYDDSVLQQKFSIRGARFDGTAWKPMVGAEGEPDIAPLHYGLLTDFPKPSNLGHQGRRLFPVLKSRKEGGVWLFYEAKADEGEGTITSVGRIFGHRSDDGTWSPPLDVTEGYVRYELPHNSTVGASSYLLSNDVADDELHLERVALSDDLPTVPEDRRTINIAQWKEVDLPIEDDLGGSPNGLPDDRQAEYRLYWGDFHAHSAVSMEMDGEPDELGHYARDKAGIHALTVSDNDCFWSRFKRHDSRYMKDYEWDYVLANAMVVNEPGRFAMFPGYEYTVTGVNDFERDHRSVMADEDEMEADPFHMVHRDAYARGERTTHKDTREAIAWFKEKGYLALPHPHHGTWNLYDTDVEWGIDICAAWMINFDLYDIFFKYLNQGHRFAFTGSGDGHHRNPGYAGALTGLWAERLDRAAILDAIKARRCYATAGQRILMEFTINDQMMGSSLTVREDPTLKWRVVGADQDYILRIHRDGRLMYDERFTGQTSGEIQEFKLCQYRPGPHYYYMEVLSPDPIPQYGGNVAHALGAKGWTSPIWVETEET
jgi:hypothetical protein